MTGQHNADATPIRPDGPSPGRGGIVSFILGVVIGAAAGLIGVGGGEFRIPVLLHALRLPVKVAAGVNMVIGLFTVTLQAWAGGVSLGEGVKSLWTGTACVATVPGRLHGLPLALCTRAQFVEEVLAQLGRCGALDALLREANGGRGWGSFPVVRVEVWHEWLFSPGGIKPPQPKWVNTTDTQGYQPTQATPVPNLVLAGAHTRTEADVWSIEAAVESGRRAARVIEPGVVVVPQYKPAWLRAIGAVDDACFAAGAPHVLDLLLVGCAIALLGVIAFALWR